MRAPRRHHTPEQKLALLRHHHLDKVAEELVRAKSAVIER